VHPGNTLEQFHTLSLSARLCRALVQLLAAAGTDVFILVVAHEHKRPAPPTQLLSPSLFWICVVVRS